MLGSEDWVVVFSGLRDRISVIEGKPRLSDDFVTWRGELFEAVAKCFGRNSPELSEIRLIPFEVPTLALEAFDQRRDREAVPSPVQIEQMHHAQFLAGVRKVHSLLNEYIIIHR